MPGSIYRQCLYEQAESFQLLSALKKWQNIDMTLQT